LGFKRVRRSPTVDISQSINVFCKNKLAIYILWTEKIKHSQFTFSFTCRLLNFPSVTLLPDRLYISLFLCRFEKKKTSGVLEFVKSVSIFKDRVGQVISRVTENTVTDTLLLSFILHGFAPRSGVSQIHKAIFCNLYRIDFYSRFVSYVTAGNSNLEKGVLVSNCRPPDWLTEC
jgi:hypothetical protein